MTHILVSRICVNEEVPVLRSKPKLELGLTAYEELFMNDKQLTETTLIKLNIYSQTMILSQFRF